MSVASLAERVMTTRPTIARIENGDPGVAVGTLLSTLYMLGLLDRIASAADPAQDLAALHLDLERLPRRIYPAKDE